MIVRTLSISCTVSHIMVMLLRSKWAAGKAVRAGLALEGAYLDRYVTDPAAAGRPPAHFQRNPPGRGRLAVFPSGDCRTRPVWIQIWALYRQSGSDRLEKQPTDPATARQHHHYMRDGTLTAATKTKGL